MRAIGVVPLLAGGSARPDVSLAAALAATMQVATRHYAKRQATWFRNQTPAWPSLNIPFRIFLVNFHQNTSFTKS